MAEESEVAAEYWKNVLIISDESLKTLEGRNRDRSRSMNRSVKDEVMKMFK